MPWHQSYSAYYPHLPSLHLPTEEMEELEDSFYQAKDAYMKLYRENRRAERPLVLQSYMFGNSQMYQILNRLGNLQERVV